MNIAHIRYTKSEVDYTDHAKMKSQRCEVCRHFNKPHGCELVAGKISPMGWCREWERLA